MAVAFDKLTTVAESVVSGNIDTTHTPVGTPRGVVVLITQVDNSGDQIASVTYGGVAMSRTIAAQDASGEQGKAYAYFLGTGIPSGAQTVRVVSNNTSPKLISIVSLTADIDTQVDTFGSIGDSDPANPQITLTATDFGKPAFAFAAAFSGAAAPTDLTEIAGQTRTHSFDSGANNHVHTRTTNTYTASRAIGWTAVADDVAMVAVAVREKVTTRAVGRVLEDGQPRSVARVKSITVGQATLSSVAQPVGRSKVRAVEGVTETDAAQPIAVVQTGGAVAVSAATETDAAQPIARAKSLSVTQATETDTPQVVTPRRTLSLGQLVEADQALAVASSKTRAIGTGAETASAQLVTSIKSSAAGAATETTATQSVTHSKVKGLSEATETEAARAATVVKSRAVQQPSVTDAAQSIGAVKTKAVGAAIETATAVGASTRKTLGVGVAETTELSLIVLYAEHVTVNEALETDSAQPVTVSTSRQEQVVAVGIATEASTSQAVTAQKIVPVGQALESGFARPISFSKRKEFGAASETSSAGAATSRKSRALGQVSDTAEATPVSLKIGNTLGQASEVGTAGALHRAKARSVGFSAATELARPVTPRKTAVVGQAESAETVGLLSPRKGLNRVSEASSALSIRVRKTRGIGRASESCTARPCIPVRVRSDYPTVGRVARIRLGHSATEPTVRTGRSLPGTAGKAATIRIGRVTE